MKHYCFEQEQQVFKHNSQSVGRLCGITWHTLNHHTYLYNTDHIASEKDTYLFFNIVVLVCNIPGEQTDTLFDIVGDLVED